MIKWNFCKKMLKKHKICCIIFLSEKPDKRRDLNKRKSWAVMLSSPRKEVVAMDNEYIISFMIILLLLVISIKK